jgi:hypothetical protein
LFTAFLKNRTNLEIFVKLGKVPVLNDKLNIKVGGFIICCTQCLISKAGIPSKLVEYVLFNLPVIPSISFSVIGVPNIVFVFQDIWLTCPASLIGVNILSTLYTK